MTVTTSTAAPSQKAGVLGFISEDEALGFMTPEVMRDLLFISDFEQEDPGSKARDKHGYQRPPDKSRIPGIARFFSSRTPWSRPTPIIVSVRLKDPKDIAEFVRLLNEGDIDGIKKKFGEAVACIVDGQHRYLGADRANEQNPEFSPRIPVMLSFGLSWTDEQEFFDVINSTPKRVPKALRETTRSDIDGGGDSYAQRIRQITRMLTLHDESVWQHEVNLTGARNPDRPVTFEGLRRSTASMFPKETLDRMDAAEIDIDKVARDYWRQVYDACSTAWDNEPLIEKDEDGEIVTIPVKYRIKELVGVAALAKLGGTIISSALEHEDFDQHVTRRVRRLNAVNWEKPTEGRAINPWMQDAQAGFAGQSGLYNVLYRWVYLDKHPAAAE